jgi:hypothetical protein
MEHRDKLVLKIDAAECYDRGRKHACFGLCSLCLSIRNKAYKETPHHGSCGMHSDCHHGGRISYLVVETIAKARKKIALFSHLMKQITVWIRELFPNRRMNGKQMCSSNSQTLRRFVLDTAVPDSDYDTSEYLFWSPDGK